MKQTEIQTRNILSSLHVRPWLDNKDKDKFLFLQ